MGDDVGEEEGAEPTRIDPDRTDRSLSPVDSGEFPTPYSNTRVDPNEITASGTEDLPRSVVIAAQATEATTSPALYVPDDRTELMPNGARPIDPAVALLDPKDPRPIIRTRVPGPPPLPPHPPVTPAPLAERPHAPPSTDYDRARTLVTLFLGILIGVAISTIALFIFDW
jgi:hypothetical protein